MGRVALDFGFIQIYWYSIFIVIGMTIGMYLVYKEAIKEGMNENAITNLIFYTVIVSIVGARLYYVAFNWSYYSNHFLEIFEIWNGGLAIHGAIIGAVLAIYIYCKKNKFSFI